MITFRIPEGLLAKLGEAAKDSNRTKVLLDIITAGLDETPLKLKELIVRLEEAVAATEKVIKTKPLKVTEIPTALWDQAARILKEIPVNSGVSVVEGQPESVPEEVSADTPHGGPDLVVQNHSARCACFICKPPKDAVAEPKKKKWGKK